MTTVLPRIATAMNSSPDPRVLQTLGMQGVSLALWTRALRPKLAQALDALPTDRLPRLRRTLAARDVAAAVRAACREAGTGHCAEMLAEEVEALVGYAIPVFATPLVELRLSVTEGQPCPKWHVDAVPGRLLCTLRGPGTEFGPIGTDGAAQTVQHMERGAVGIFRGVLWPGQELAAIVHRSPPREAGGPRLLVVIDPVDDAGSC